jgi:hypothetical protein
MAWEFLPVSLVLPDSSVAAKDSFAASIENFDSFED